MHLSDTVRACSANAYFGRLMNILEDLLIDDVVVVSSFGVLSSESFVNQLLSATLDPLPVGYERDIEKHVSSEHERAGRSLERSGNHRSKGKLRLS
jgi:hypothetical protein